MAVVGDVCCTTGYWGWSVVVGAGEGWEDLLDVLGLLLLLSLGRWRGEGGGGAGKTYLMSCYSET